MSCCLMCFSSLVQSRELGADVKAYIWMSRCTPKQRYKMYLSDKTVTSLCHFRWQMAHAALSLMCLWDQWLQIMLSYRPLSILSWFPPALPKLIELRASQVITFQMKHCESRNHRITKVGKDNWDHIVQLTLSERKMFLIYNLNLSWLNLRPLPLFLSL